MAKVAPLDRRDFRSKRYNNNRPWRNFTGHTGLPTAQVVSIVFKEPMHQIPEKIKAKPYFKWPNKRGVTSRGVIRIFIANIIKTMDILQNIVELGVTIWNS